MRGIVASCFLGQTRSGSAETHPHLVNKSNVKQPWSIIADVICYVNDKDLRSLILMLVLMLPLMLMLMLIISFVLYQ